MLGIVIVPPFSNDVGICYDRVKGRSVLEHVIDACMGCAQAQKIIVSWPLSERSNITGGYTKSPLIKFTKELAGKRVSWDWYEGDCLDGVYQAAVLHGLDQVIVIGGDQALMQSWLINSVAEKHFRGSWVVDTNQFPVGLRMYLYPFWVLAKLYVESESRQINNLDYSKMLLVMGSVQNYDDVEINTSHNLIYSRDEKERLIFNYYLEGIDMGYDLQELISEFDSGVNSS